MFICLTASDDFSYYETSYTQLTTSAIKNKNNFKLTNLYSVKSLFGVQKRKQLNQCLSSCFLRLNRKCNFFCLTVCETPDNFTVIIVKYI